MKSSLIILLHFFLLIISFYQISSQLGENQNPNGTVYLIENLCSTCETEEEKLSPGYYFYVIELVPNDELTITLKVSSPTPSTSTPPKNVSFSFLLVDYLPTDTELIGRIKDFTEFHYDYNPYPKFHIQKAKIAPQYTNEFLVIKLFLDEEMTIRIGSSSSVTSTVGLIVIILCVPWVVVGLIVLIFKKCCCLCRRQKQTTSDDILKNYNKKILYTPPLNDNVEESFDTKTGGGSTGNTSTVSNYKSITGEKSGDGKLLPNEN